MSSTLKDEKSDAYDYDIDVKGEHAHIDVVDAESAKGKTAHVADDAAAGFIDPTLVITPQENVRLRRRIHKRILPLLCLAYLCQALDKGTTATSSIMGWQEDIGAKGQDYALTSTFLWVGIIIGEPFSNQLVRRLPLAKLLSAGVFIWSVLLLGLAFCLNVHGVFAIRALLGLFESLVGPCVLALTVQWYLIEEQPFVSSLWQCMLGAQSAINGILGFGFYHVKMSAGLRGWQWMTICVAMISFASSVVLLVFLPDAPTKARWASREEKTRFVERVRPNNQGLKHKVFKRSQAIEAFTDPYTLLLFLLPVFQTLVVGGIGTFNSLLLNKAFHFTVLQSQLLNIPLGAMTVLMYMLISYLIKKTNQTLYVMILFTIPNIIGTIVLITVAPTEKTKGPLLVPFYMMQVFQACNPAIFLMLSRNSAGQTKKSITYAVTYIGWAGGNSISAQLFQAKWAPRYIPSLYIHLGLYAVWICLILITRVLLVRRNKAKDAAQAAQGLDGARKNELAFEDLTDLENPDFRYCI